MHGLLYVVSVHQVKKNKRGSYTRDGLDIEVVAGRDDTYPSCWRKHVQH